MRKVKAKKPSLKLTAKGDFRTTTNGRAGGLLCKDRIAQRSPIQTAATIDVV
ncbi:hypothetical protein J6590_025068 [Homalodisca vitripennis]|nr:hypothetical protein J6590_025068 [Homalodisca vitripennis]